MDFQISFSISPTAIPWSCDLRHCELQYLLYGSELLDPPFPIDTINTATGQATIGPALTGVNAGGAIYGLAPTQQSLSTPEPATLALLFVGLGVFPLIRTGINRARR